MFPAVWKRVGEIIRVDVGHWDYYKLTIILDMAIGDYKHARWWYKDDVDLDFKIPSSEL